MFVGYARVSSQDQNLNLQKDALKKAGCEKIFTDKESGLLSARPGLERTLETLRKGDTLIVWRLDRLGRSLKNLIQLMAELEEKKIAFRSLQESINTASPGGKLIFHMFGALAEFERNLIRERTMAGLTAARARGRKGGRPKSLDSKKQEDAIKLYNQRNHSVQEICRIMGISKTTLYEYLRSHRVNLNSKP